MAQILTREVWKKDGQVKPPVSDGKKILANKMQNVNKSDVPSIAAPWGHWRDFGKQLGYGINTYYNPNQLQHEENVMA